MTWNKEWPVSKKRAYLKTNKEWKALSSAYGAWRQRPSVLVKQRLASASIRRRFPEAHLGANQEWRRRALALSRSQIMARIKSVSMLEIAARPVASRVAGCRLRHQPRGVFGKPDYANISKKVAVFVHGCFFHGCPQHYRTPKTRPVFWDGKIGANQRRHGFVARRLRADGWRVLTIWECKIRAELRGL